MQTYQVSSSTKIEPIDFGASGKVAILQNVSFLLNSLVDTYPMHREFGMNPPVDDPCEIAINEWSAQVIEKLERNIPEVSVIDVEVIQNEADLLNGRIQTIVKVVIEVDPIQSS
ncbi:MAG: hypothetical protein F9K39_04410 [Exiguobacterium chiriqhucha]|uniref:hypothetical protein n=1 Tax=Exiguobacterium chiriqhucha TaxID=1385984 RepID=UPI00144E13BF|nr:hypothetical protein [Exiguobacterium chiriqhucha]KAB2864653.1 MAG: hypothetical protein F9K39_04410 [Exiguobacterium chiriqhucha]